MTESYACITVMSRHVQAQRNCITSDWMGLLRLCLTYISTPNPLDVSETSSFKVSKPIHFGSLFIYVFMVYLTTLSGTQSI
jgi:hypothetical protein